MSNSDKTAKLQRTDGCRVHLKLKASDAVVLNVLYNEGPLPDDLTLFDEEDDSLINPSFIDIQQNFSIEYMGIRYHFNDPIQDRRKDESAVAGLVVDEAPPYRPRSMDISNQVAAVFECEVNAYLDDYFQSVLPRCSFSRFKSREIEDDATLEIDSFAYMTHDTLEPPEINNTLGIYVVGPSGITKMKPMEALRMLANSPGAKAACLERTAQKYVVGESYSGDGELSIKGKVKELEVKLNKLKNRHEIQSEAVSDATSLFGAAILSFTCQSLPRRDQSKKCMKLVLKQLSSVKTPILWRLAQADRLFILVLSTKDGPSTCAMRELSQGMQSLEMTVMNVDTRVANVDAKVMSVERRVISVETRVLSVETSVRSVDARVMNVETSVMSVDARLMNVETRVMNVETRVMNVETRVRSVDARLMNVETRVMNVETRLMNVETSVKSVDSRLMNVETRVMNVESGISAILGRLDEIWDKKGQKVRVEEHQY